MMGLSAGAMMALPGFLRAQTTASTGNPAQEITARYNKSAANDDKVYKGLTDPVKSKPIVLYNNGNSSDPDPVEYSIEHNVITFALAFGQSVPQEKREWALDYIENTTFAGNDEAPLTFIIYPDMKENKLGFSAAPYIEGRHQKSADDKGFYNFDQLRARASALAETWRFQNLGTQVQSYAPLPEQN